MGVDRTRLKLRAFNRKRKRFGEDLCDILAPAQVSDGESGHKLDYEPVATEVECFIEQAGTGSPDVEVDGVFRTTTHTIEIGSLDEDKQAIANVIDQSYRIRVQARNSNPAMLFEQPVRQIQSFTPLVVVNAIFTQGVRRPASQ